MFENDGEKITETEHDILFTTKNSESIVFTLSLNHQRFTEIIF